MLKNRTMIKNFKVSIILTKGEVRKAIVQPKLEIKTGAFESEYRKHILLVNELNKDVAG
jgi:hypothetical protein